jgi:WD40 repeat protein
VNGDPEAAEPPRRVRSADARGARGVLAGDFGIQVNIFNGTWTDAVAPPLADQDGKIDSPYRGLSQFEQWDERFFFGREEAASAVLERVGTSGLLMVSGVSGAGKSSLVRAGVLPRISNGELAAPGSASWPRVVLTPTASPLDELAERVAPVARTDAATVRSDLTVDPASFAHTARHAAEAASPGLDPSARRLLLVVDQFEQLFTRCSDEEQRRAFIAALHAAANGGADTDPAAGVILVVRADFEARCAEYPELTSVVQDRYLVTSMTERQLRRAVTEPAKRAGSHVEDELVEVLLREMRDTASPPSSAAARDGWGAGALPLLSHALDQAWRERAGKALTLADYERTGGIEGALAESADGAYQRLTQGQREAAQRVFTRLVATSDDGLDTTDRVARTELTAGADAADVEKVLETFADARLLTLAAGTVEISHEVLLTAWPLLRDSWLDEVHADRMVRARLQLVAAEWSRNGRDRSYLYQGGLLDTATRSADRIRTDPRHRPLDRDENEFLRASAQAHRRRIRTRQLVTAVLTVLALGAATLSAVASYRGDQVTTQLRAANAEALGQESLRRLPTDAATAAQLALAAWHSDPKSPQARTALANAYLALPTLDAEVTGVATDPIKNAWVRGDTVLLPAGPLTVITGVSGPTPRRWEVPNLPADLPEGDLSPDGRWFAYFTRDGRLQLRDVLTRADPVTVASGQQPGHIAFSPDSRRLAWITDDGPPQTVQVRVCDLAECAKRPPDTRPLPGTRTIYGFWLTPDPDRVLVRYDNPNFDSSRLVVRSIANGSELTTMAPGSTVVRGGAAVVSCEPAARPDLHATATIVVTPVVGAAPPTRFASTESACGSGLGVSTDGGWLVEQPEIQPLSHVPVRLTDLASGQRRWVSIPAWQQLPSRFSSVPTLGVTTVAGQPTVLFAHGTSLLRLRTELGPDDRDTPAYRWLADGNRYVSLFPDTPTPGQSTVSIEDRATGRRIATIPGLPGKVGAKLAGNSMWVVSPANNRTQVDRYELSPVRKVASFVPPGPEQGGPGFGAIFSSEGNTPTMLTVSGGVLAVLDPLTGRPLATPVTLGPAEEFADLDGNVVLTPRPGRPPGQLAVGGARDVQIWDAPGGRKISDIPVPARGVAFDPSGERIAILTQSETIEIWSVEPARRLLPPIPAPDGQSLIGFDADGYLDVLTGLRDRLMFIDLTDGDEAGSMDSVDGVDSVDNAGDPVTTVVGNNGALAYQLPLTARAWHDRLCAAANRPFTPAERDLLPPGADDGPPC